MKEILTKAAQCLRETLRDLGSETDVILFDIVLASFDDEIKELQARPEWQEAYLDELEKAVEAR